jgi:hypothetical protein
MLTRAALLCVAALLLLALFPLMVPAHLYAGDLRMRPARDSAPRPVPAYPDAAHHARSIREHREVPVGRNRRKSSL